MTGDQVMAALQLGPGAALRPRRLRRLPGAQPDMGTKWAPRFVRVAEALPVTATSKVLTRLLAGRALARRPTPSGGRPTARAPATDASSPPRPPPWTRP